MWLYILVASWPLPQTGKVQSFHIKLEFLQFIENTLRTQKFSWNNNTQDCNMETKEASSKEIEEKFAIFGTFPVM